MDKASLNYLTEKYPDAMFVSSTKGTNIEKLISEITTNVFGDLNEVSLIISPKDLDQLHKYSSIVSVKNCLLYTSPSPRDAHESRMPSSA